ncbi:MAG: hypothetical protein ACP5P0_01270 [Hydrogenobacter sp.]|jgi:hypothetical protein
MIDIILERLSKIANEHPHEALECLELIVDKSKRISNLSYNEHIENILKVCLKFPATKEQARRVANLLISYGFMEYKQLLDKENS